MPSLNKLYLKLAGNPRLVFLFINQDDDNSQGRTYLEKNRFSIPFYTLPDGISNEIFSGSLPTTVVLDKEGKVVLKHQGMARYDTDEFIRELSALL